MNDWIKCIYQSYESSGIAVRICTDRVLASVTARWGDGMQADFGPRSCTIKVFHDGGGIQGQEVLHPVWGVKHNGLQH